MKKRIIDYHESDEKWIERFNDEIRKLSGIVLEAVRDNPAMLLSPICREILVDRALALEEMRKQVIHKLCVDNLNEPLK